MNAPASGKTFGQVAPAGITGLNNNFFLFDAEVYYRQLKNIYTVEDSTGIQKEYSYDGTSAAPYCGAAYGKWGKMNR